MGRCYRVMFSVAYDDVGIIVGPCTTPPRPQGSHHATCAHSLRAAATGAPPAKPETLCVARKCVTSLYEGRGEEGGYRFFAGRDATRAFMTGDFAETGN